MIVYLFGGYERAIFLAGPHGPRYRMRFLTLRAAQNYGTWGLSAIDPYAIYMSQEITWVPGKWLRKGAAE